MIYKCSSYTTLCPFRGSEINEEHKTQFGRYFNYAICTTDGKWYGKDCKYCVCDNGDGKNHRLVKRTRRSFNSDVRIVKVGKNPKDKSLV